MFGPVFNREAVVMPRRPRSYLSRSLFVLSLFLLLCTGYLVLIGTQPLESTADHARFGGWMFLLLAPVQLLVLGFQASVTAASSVAQEKDRRTLLLLLMTRISGFEVVVGKLAATLLGAFSMLLAALPLFLAITLFGGVSLRQLGDVYLVTAVTVIAAATVGTVVGLWREKSFQTIAVTLLLLALWIGLGEVIASGAVSRLAASHAAWLSPPRALLAALEPLATPVFGGLRASILYSIFTAAITVAVALVGIVRLRVWNPSREVRGFVAKESEPAAVSHGSQMSSQMSGQLSGQMSVEASVGTQESGTGAEQEGTWKIRAPRRVWDNPILWREVRTRAYGSKVLFIRAAYLAIFVLIAAALYQLVQSGVASQRPEISGRVLPAATIPMAALVVVSLVMVNALAVSSITSERDLLAFDLLLVTDLTPREFLAGKILGVLYVAKEMLLLPAVLVTYLMISGVISAENMVYALMTGMVLFLFAAMLGVHCGLTYPSGRTSTMISLGTIFFLCVGIAICMVIMVSFRGAFQLQLAPFLIIILGGGAALYAAIGWRNPSSAVFAASIALPLVTYYAITQFLLQHDQLPAALTLICGYGFATAAMLVPALSDFDVADHRDRGASGDGET